MSEAQQDGIVAARNHLPPQWQDWIAENFRRGCREADMIQVMIDNGFEPVFAGSAIAVMRDMAARPSAATPSPPVAVASAYTCDPIRIGQRSCLDGGDRGVDVGFAMTDPNVALFENLLTADECEELIELSAGKLRRSEVVNRETGAFEVNSVRTSEGTYFARGENETIRRIESRIAALTGIPVENGEPLQILHYQVGGEYLPHHDFFDPADPGSALHMRAGGQRVATLVIYLNTVADGGETGFPGLKLQVKALQGSAIYFEYMNRSGQLDTRCLHSGNPVRDGEKWIATKWLRQSAYVRPAGE